MKIKDRIRASFYVFSWDAVPSETGQKPRPTKASWDLHDAVLRRHHLSLGIPHYQPDHITSRGDIKCRLDRNAGFRHGFKRLVLQTHLDNLLSTAHIVPITVEHASDDREGIVVASIRLAVAEMPRIHARKDRKSGFVVSGLEELRMQLDREIVDLVARKERLLHFLLGLL